MKKVNFSGKRISGISVRTSNAREFDPSTAKIANLYKEFDEKVTVDYKNGARVYGVYYDYDSDHSGEFSVLAGADCIADSSRIQLEEVTLENGDYLVFEAQGVMPQVVIDTWGEIWDYFSNDKCEYQRAYLTDFEHYKNQDEVNIYISVK